MTGGMGMKMDINVYISLREQLVFSALEKPAVLAGYTCT